MKNHVRHTSDRPKRLLRAKVLLPLFAVLVLAALAALYFLLPEKTVFPIRRALYSETRNDRVNDYVFSVDASSPGRVLPNVKSHLNVFGGRFAEDQPVGEANPFAFTEYIQLMECSGGNAARDLFRDPDDFSVTDDYDFAPLLASCRGILKVGAKPLLKLGNVPKKLSQKALAAAGEATGDFSVNVYPPDDYDEYYRYIKALAVALVEEFGPEEVVSWRFGVLTEYENAGWFRAVSGDPEESMRAFCALYDYTVQALTDVLGESVFVGAHSMTVSEGLWDECDFIRHCGTGTNFATGKTGTRLCYLSASYYEQIPGGKPEDRLTLPETVGVLQTAAREAGLTDLRFGIDEGRVLVGETPGVDSDELLSRSVGATYQAGFDARLLKQSFDCGLDYFSAWGYCSAGFTGLPTVSYYVAEQGARFAGCALLPVSAVSAGKLRDADVNVSAALDRETGTLRVMAYNYKDSLYYLSSADVTVEIAAPSLPDGDASVTVYRIDDDCNWFDEWQRDRVSWGFPDDVFAWSPDDGEPLFVPGDAAARFAALEPTLAPFSVLTPETYPAEVKDGRLTLSVSLPPNAVAFFEVTP